MITLIDIISGIKLIPNMVCRSEEAVQTLQAKRVPGAMALVGLVVIFRASASSGVIRMWLPKVKAVVSILQNEEPLKTANLSEVSHLSA